MSKYCMTLAATLLVAHSVLPVAAQAQGAAPISWWYETATPENKKQLQQLLIQPFNEAHPEYRLNIDYRGAELDKQLRVAMLSRRGPDIVYTAGPSYVATIANAGQLLPLDGYAAKLGWNDRLLPLFLEMGKYKGKLYALPKTYETMGMFYNKTLFDKEGWQPPKNIAELEKLAEAMKAKGITPFAAGNADWRAANEHYVTLVLNTIAGPDNIYKALNGELPWTAEPFVKAITTLQQWWQKGYFGANYFSLTQEQAFAQVASGKAGIAPSGTWNFSYIPTYFPASHSEAGFAPFPTGEGVDYPVYPLGIGSTFSIAASSKNPDGAAAVIDYVFSENFYSKINSVWQGEWNTPLKDLSHVQLDAKVLPLYTETMKNLAGAVAQNHYGYTSWTFLPPATDSYLVNAIEQVWLGQMSVKDFLTTLDATYQQEKKDGKVPTIPSRQ